MKTEIACTNLKLDSNTEKQIDQCLSLVKEIFDQDLLGVYLYGSAMLDGLQKYSDIDLFVVLSRPTTYEEKTRLVSALLKISGVYMKSTKLPIEMTIVEKAEINPWHYPPKFDFQYGDWLRNQFESGNIEPWESKVMTNLALMITQLLLSNKTLFGIEPNQLLPTVPYQDFINATTDGLQGLMADLDWDIRNVLLTFARVWSTVATDTIRSKSAAVDWVITYLPEKFHPVMQRAKAICKGQEKECWDDMRELIKPCAEFMLKQINKKINEIKLSDNTSRSIKIAFNK